MTYDVKLYGCSFTENYNGLQVMPTFDELGCNVINYGKQSSSNSDIYDKILKTVNKGDILVIQWSAITRRMIDDYHLLESKNPLYSLLERWYSILDNVQQLVKEKNLYLIQYVGWAMWKDDELNDYHREKLNSYDIRWFHSSECWDVIESNCAQIQPPNHWSSDEENGLFHWSEMKWGGLSEWGRENVDISKRYMGRVHKDSDDIDPHPSQHTSIRFVKEVVLDMIREKIRQKQSDQETK